MGGTTQRRAFLLTGLAAAGFAVAGAAQVASPSFDVPKELQVRSVRIEGVRPGEIHVIPEHFALYWTQPDGTAWRYPIGIGRPGLYVAGTFRVGDKKVWPRWTPTPAMIAREPEIYARWANGMPGGAGNPLGARALYLYRGGRDSLLRIHGSASPDGIGDEVSSGCARLLNTHIAQLYELVPIGTRVVLHPKK